ncbi:hypothetical protein WJ94_15150 [Burkholderia ubonensis]|uniref:gp53-like domain-containing protein n=1 Tax=Burkholderia ubonensis TaxID=101571 RepID=UPI000758D144|nr:hypothetical protein [Burkholderia ubonensis]KVP78216.1 hypothetical protein WJ94_15150 [Burkholderia ubonensis]
MSNLIESDRWEDGIYQLETSDPVIGGPDGVDNLQAKQLANRTRFLKRLVEAGQSNLDAHANAVDPHPQYATKTDLAQRLAELVGQSPAALDTLKELAEALGNDPNFATTITNDLAKKAPIDSPVFTGTPKGPTPPQFDSSTKLATMAAVQRALGGASSMKLVGAAVALDVTYAGADVVLYGNSGPFTQVLPPVSTYPSGVGMRFYNASGFPVTIQTAGNDRFSAFSGTVASIVVGTGDSLVLSAYGPSNWEVMGGSAALPWSSLFGSSLAANGYQKLPSGLIIQWGVCTPSTNADAWVTFPIAFSSAIYSVSTSASATSGQPGFANYNAITLSGMYVGGYINSARAGYTCSWIAIGK